jgi:hypothetical protein
MKFGVGKVMFIGKLLPIVRLEFFNSMFGVFGEISYKRTGAEK